MIRVGLTGSIASGKSTVGKCFQGAGFQVLDADDVVHDLYAEDQDLVHAVLEAFPSARDINGGIDREHLGDLVFNDFQELARLERIVHPLVLQYISAWFSSQSDSHQTKGVAVVEAALWNRWQAAQELDVLITVEARPELRKQRLMQGGLLETQAQMRLEAQGLMPTEESETLWVIHNNNSLEDLEAAAKKLVRRLQKVSSAGGKGLRDGNPGN